MGKAEYLKTLEQFKAGQNASMKKPPESKGDIAHNMAIDNPNRSAYLNALMATFKLPQRTGIKTARQGARVMGYELNEPVSPEFGRRQDEARYLHKKTLERPKERERGPGLDW